MRIVGDTQLIRDRQQQSVGLGDGLVLPELLDEDVRLSGIAPAEDCSRLLVDKADFVLFLGMISVNLAVINFLPIPVLDGGHFVFLLYEKLRIPRVTKVARESIDSRHFTQMPDGPQQEERDEYLLAHPGIHVGHRNNRSRKEFLDELFGYDAYKVLETAHL